MNPSSINHHNWTTANPRLSFQLGTTLSVPADYGSSTGQYRLATLFDLMLPAQDG